VPTIGNGVWIGPNAIVVGGITVGDNALIAPGALVNFDVPADAVVVGNPGQIVSSGGAEGYVRFKHQEAAGGAAPVPAAR
jgi:serine O-acetyltransferase